MPYLNHNDFQTVRTAVALAARMNAEALPEFDWGKSPLTAAGIQLLNEAPPALLQAQELLDNAVLNVASPDLCELARTIHASDDLEIDDEGAGASQGDGGTWVQAWVWVDERDMIDAGIAETPADE